MLKKNECLTGEPVATSDIKDDYGAADITSPAWVRNYEQGT